MADFVSSYTGEQIDTAVGKVLEGGGSSGRTVVASNVHWDGVGYKTISVPMRPFTEQPNYILRGYVGDLNGAWAFNCETCESLLTDGVDFTLSGLVLVSATSNTHMQAYVNYIDPSEDTNPYGESAYDTLSIRLAGSYSGLSIVFTDIIEETL